MNLNEAHEECLKVHKTKNENWIFFEWHLRQLFPAYSVVQAVTTKMENKDAESDDTTETDIEQSTDNKIKVDEYKLDRPKKTSLVQLKISEKEKM